MEKMILIKGKGRKVRTMKSASNINKTLCCSSLEETVKRTVILNICAIYSHGGHLGHVTWTIYVNFYSPFLRMLHMKLNFNRPSGFREI